jgi:hypothetical protein
MSAGRDKLSKKMEVAIACLLTASTNAEAATKAGVSEASLQRWLRLPEFLRAYRDARRAVLERAIGQLQHLSAAAVAALGRNLQCGKSAVEVRAAIAVLEFANRGLQALDFEQRLKTFEEKLEQLTKESK